MGLQIQHLPHPDHSERFSRKDIAQFLFEHLERFGDPLHQIEACLDYVAHPNKGGFVLLAAEEDRLKGVLVMNKTGMSGYIPENILVYIAVDASCRGEGIGAQIMEKALQTAEGAVALHVESDNPAKRLYERLGFENKYLEMRYQKA